MAGSVNKVILIGNLGKDPETRTTQTGSKIVNLTLATSESWNDKASGERKERTEWHRVVIFNERVAEVVEKYLRKGRRVYIEGSLQTRKWTDQSGMERYVTEVVVDRVRGEMTLLDSAQDETAGAPAARQSLPRQSKARRPAPVAATTLAGGWDDLNDEIPF